MQLKKMQELFVSAMASQGAAVELADFIVPCGSLTDCEAIEVYSADYKARMFEALGKNYEATWLVMGDEDFLTDAGKYILSHPSDLTNLTFYGDSFPSYLEAIQSPLEAVQMASFEKAFWSYFHAPSNPSLELTKEILEKAHFDLSGIFLLESELRLDLLWHCRESGMESLGEANIYEDSCFSIYKGFSKVEVIKISPQAFKILRALKEVGRIPELTYEERDSAVWAEALNVLMFSKIKK